jgi:hypothetical protein
MSEQSFIEYVVTLHKKEDLDQFYLDMENESDLEFVPKRAVECVSRRSMSRNTHYKLTEEEAVILRKDIRVKAVSLTLSKMKIKIIPHASQTGSFSRSNDTTISNGDINWGLLRSSLNSNISNWGVGGAGQITQNSSVNFTATGKNVDVVVVDKIAFQEHPEFGERFVDYDWFFNHNSTVWSENPVENYRYYQTTPGDSYTGANNHATHVAAIIAGETQGWAKEANIYNLRHDTDSQNPGSYTPPEYLIDYIRAFHNNKSVNLETGRKNPTLVNNSWAFNIPVGQTNPTIPTGNSKISKIFYRGEFIDAADLENSVIDTGYSGFCNTNTRIGAFTGFTNAGMSFISTDSTTATVTTIPVNLQGTGGLTDLEEPSGSSGGGVDIYDDAFWQISLPFTVTYLGSTYTQGTSIFVNSNSFLKFGGSNGSDYNILIGAAYPLLRKIHISAGDRSVKAVYSGISGTEGSRIFRIRYEGYEGAYGRSQGGDADIVWEISFFEAEPNKVEVHIGENSAYRAEFTISQLENYGIMQTTGTGPYLNAAIDADIEDAIDDGIIFISSAGNDKFKIDLPDGDDYDNYFVDNGEVIYYHRGATPAVSHPEIVVVGSLDNSVTENKQQVSATGPRVDVYAPGVGIASAVFDPFGVTGKPAATDGSPGADIQTISRSDNIATITTSSEHNFSNGDLVTVSCNFVSFNTSRTPITVTGPNTFTYSNTGSVVAGESADGTAYIGYLYQKYNGTSMSAAQVTGILALALQEYPDMDQAMAREYVIAYSKKNLMTVTTGSFEDSTSLQGGNNRIAYYNKERKDQGNVFPKINQRVRPLSGMVFPRIRIKK